MITHTFIICERRSIMKNYDLITPEGTRDLLFEECIIRRGVENVLTGIFSGRGYTEMITSGLEFYDVFSLNSRYFPQENLYKLTDTKGRLIVIRPDSTMPIARVIATRLRDAVLPLRLYYRQNVYRTEPLLKGRSDEIMQAGIELVGSDSEMADLEVISTAVESLKSLDMEFSIELGHIGIFKELVSRLDVSRREREKIRRLIENKDFPALNDYLDTFGRTPVTDALKRLPALFGGEEVFDRAEELIPDDSLNIRRILSYMREIYSVASEFCGEGGNISVDLGIVNKTDYYTGIVFKGYLEGHGDEVVSGGRYDGLIAEFGYDVPAVGFAVNIDAISKVIEKNGILPALPRIDAIVFAREGFEADAFRKAQELREQGLVVETALSGDIDSVREYARERKIARIVIAGEEM